MIYKKIWKPLLFRMDPEFVHNRALFTGRLLGKFSLIRSLIARFFSYKNKALQQKIHGITFQNPIGLAAGFDKDAHLMRILPAIGFGYEEIGSVTAKSYGGNPGARLKRLPKYKSLIVNYGLKSDGCREVAERLKGKKFAFPIGISIAKTNSQETVDVEKGIQDYVKGFTTLEKYADYVTINISCPNTFGGQPFSDPVSLHKLLTQIDKIETVKPIFLKMSPDLTKKEVDAIIEVCDKHNIQGFVISNLVKKRLPESLHVAKGGVSGKVTTEIANELISYVFKETKGRYTIVGCGGIFTAEDAYEKIIRGASLLQLITGMIYEGPGVIKKINQGLVSLLKRDGFTHISEAVGCMYNKNLGNNS